jgi:hypothetical protein
VFSTNLLTMVAAGAILRRHSPNGGIQWPVASSEAWDVLHWAMRPASHRRIRMEIEITSDLPTFFVVADSLLPTNIAKKHSNS